MAHEQISILSFWIEFNYGLQIKMFGYRQCDPKCWTKEKSFMFIFFMMDAIILSETLNKKIVEVEKRRPSFCVSVSPSRPHFYFILEEEWEIALYPRRHQPSGNIVDLFNPWLKFRLLKDSHNWLECSVGCEILSIYWDMAMGIKGKFEHTIE